MKKILISGVVILAMPIVSSLAIAGVKTNIDATGKGDTTKADAVSRISMAQDLAAYGEKNKDSLALIVAAKILKENPTQAVAAKKASEGKGSGATAKETGTASSSVASILDHAKKYAAGRKDLIAIANDVASTSSRGRVGGSRLIEDRVKAGHSDVWTMTFRGGEEALVAVKGHRNTDLDFYIYDEGGHLIKSDTDSTSLTALRWTPKWTGKFKIKIKNLGDSGNSYKLLMN